MYGWRNYINAATKAAKYIKRNRKYIGSTAAIVGANTIGKGLVRKRKFNQPSRRTTFKPRTFKKGSYSTTTSVRKLSKKVSMLAQEAKSSRSTLIYHKRSTDTAKASVNQTAYVMADALTMSNYEAVLAQLRFFNPSTPGTLTQADGATGTYMRDYLFKSIYHMCTAVNNYQVPAKVTIYSCVPKQDTNIAPITAFQNGLADVGNPASTSPMVYLSDSDEFNDLWRIDKSITKVLQPGQTLSCVFTAKNMRYSPATFDSHSLSYQSRFKCQAFIVRVTGVLGHDTSVASEQGFLASGIDCTCHAKHVVEYDGGIDLKYIYITDGSDSFTNGGVVSERPIADNIAYSVP